MAPFIVVLGTQIQIMKMRSPKLIIKNTTQKVMAKSGFGRNFHDLKYFEVGFVFHIPSMHYKIVGIITKNYRKPSN